MAQNKQLELPLNIAGFCNVNEGSDCTYRRKAGRPAKLKSWEVCPCEPLDWLKCGKSWDNAAQR